MRDPNTEIVATTTAPRPLRLTAAVLGAFVLAVVIGLAVFLADEAYAATLPQGFTETQVATGLTGPTTMELAPDGRIFAAQQQGQLRVIDTGGNLLATPAVDLSGKIDSQGERGLLGIAFDPAFASNGWIYLYYTHERRPQVAIHNRVSRFTVSGNTINPASERLILRLDNLSAATNHNGGAIHFGRDNRLYVAVGENATREHSQSFNNRFGKMLRINKDGSIPGDNPFYRNPNVRGVDKSIWALGLRNPYTFAFQPGTGRMYINDVGAQTWEEINAGARGANYGWPVFEGPEQNRRYTPPAFAYRHGNTATTGCAITGGAFYNPATVTFPTDFVGDYFYADFCAGWLRRYDPASDSSTAFATGASNPVDLKVGPGGSLYYLERGTGSVFKIDHPG